MDREKMLKALELTEEDITAAEAGFAAVRKVAEAMISHRCGYDPNFQAFLDSDGIGMVEDGNFDTSYPTIEQFLLAYFDEDKAEFVLERQQELDKDDEDE